jgi:ubiquinone/menaquinone biosynthesis C-methylase UbiE
MFTGEDAFIGSIPADSCKQVHPHFQLRKILNSLKSPANLLDLGCGTGNTYERFLKYSTNIKWHGLDIESSPEVAQRKNSDLNFYSYDGVHIPFPDEYFDIVYSNQALEHVVLPFELMREIHRVIKRNGYFTGSVSYLEPYHSYSTYNYTPYGLKKIFEDNGLHLIELRPGPDVFTMLFQRIFCKISLLSKLSLYYFDNESIPNQILSLIFKAFRKSNKEINVIKLLFSGHIRFLAQKN